ncbi:MAG: Tol-Pal system beta propeller repeat protein TolB [Pseudomonadota bacterium]|nr:Tol-Pal system beta propeller repeat protein TolB [Pseudomonadota bacterium]
MKTVLTGFLALLMSLVGLNAMAVLTIEITEGGDSGIPIAVVPFEFEGRQKPEHGLRSVIAADLHRSGRFELLPTGDFLSRPGHPDQVRFKDWRLIKAEALAVGQISQSGDDRYDVTFYLFDVFKEKQLAGYRWSVQGTQMRKVAHQISDHIYQAMTGVPGAFDTRIAYVTMENSSGNERTYRLMVADSDGHSAQEILRTNFPILSPAWSPSGNQLAYVSFASRTSGAMIWLQDIQTGTRSKLLEERGTASAPAWSPDGRRLALTLSRDGNSDIYVLDIAKRKLRRLTRHQAIDTEAAWSPNGRYIVFTSDRTGRPQIHRMSITGGPAELLTHEGRENARASYGPDGNSMVLVTNRGKGYRIGVFYVDSGKVDVLTDGTLDESPTFAPNGAMILYATQRGRQGVLAAVSADGRVKQILKLHQGEVREPAWSSRSP